MTATVCPEPTFRPLRIIGQEMQQSCGGVEDENNGWRRPRTVVQTIGWRQGCIKAVEETEKHYKAIQLQDVETPTTTSFDYKDFISQTFEVVVTPV